ncbi:HTH-type transcriptional repressor YtrA [Rubripirellula lacrimiformis]|uniref:HTH-type transcriptional repressor YtrA n=1 Tax=Rubripirellula lacrimiformis TaxID=1930273 RepID=A0A517N7L7_9BACT|nr:GntR family transcriptional regulator [Rubripirellula lacrimiformis]QDT03134.1 HTH-type transcriptional repressor YtrA [Rubripirellula lacrimiformis]
MRIHISSDGVPIYQQIVDQIRTRIFSGGLNTGDELPAIRTLAESLRVNPNTVARAYRELENDGLVEKRRTTGTFVAETTQQRSVAQRRRSLEPHLDNLIIQSRHLGFTIDDVVGLLMTRDEKLSGENPSEKASGS